RRLVQVSALVGGGLLLGVALPRARARATGGAAGAALNAYVRIKPDGTITLIMCKVEMGQGTYTSLPMLIAEELEVGLDQIQLEAAPPDAAVYGVDGLQETGGSTSIRDCWLPLRRAGATARMMLIAAAAQTWDVPVQQCRAASGAVIHAASGRHLSYGALASRAANTPVPSEPKLKSAAEFKLIGRNTARLDSPAKINGSATFGIDVALPGLRIAALAVSPVEGGSVVRPLGTAAALAVRGVQQVVDEGDLVAVVADNTWSAMKGLAALDLKWNDGPNVAVQQSMIVAALDAATREPGAVAQKTGDPASAMAHAVTHIEAHYRQPFLAHATMEPMNCTVHWHDGRCEIWVGTQAPDRAVVKLAALGLQRSQIQLHNQLIGGGFGRRLEVDGIVIAVRIARHVDGPVKVLWSREQDIQHDRYRPCYADWLRAGLDANGMPLAWLHTIAGSAVTAVYYGEPLKNDIDDDAVEAAANTIYPFANMEVRFVRCEPSGVPTSWWRGVGPTRNVFVIESFIDELAAAAKRDPLQYRRALLKEPRMIAVLDAAAQRADWGKPLPPRHGRGVSLQFAFGSYLTQIVEVSVTEDGQVRVQRVVCVLDCGQTINPDTIHAQLEGGVVFGLSAALHGEITIADGRVQQSNFNDYRVQRLSECPQIDSHLIASAEAPGGVGETATACIAAAVCNAVYAATGKRIRSLPISRALGS
ncbi:MAG TPA: molybdopterin cofactor-binding domain-containing protein, partial [Steroidobacteraceae bacterium]